MGAAILDPGDLEPSLDGAEIWDDNLEIGHLPVKEDLTHPRVARRVAKDPRAADARRLDACARKELAPAAGGFEARDINALGVKAHARRAQPRHRLEIATAGEVDLDEEVLAVLNCH